MMLFIDLIKNRLKKPEDGMPIDLLALASVTSDTVKVLSDGDLRRLEKLCHDSFEEEMGEEEEAMGPSLLVTAQGIEVSKAVEISNRSWSDVDKSRLPRSCFLHTTSEKKADWRLPVYEGAGGIDSETGMYRRRGALNANAVRAARAMVAGARSGKPMDVPDSVKTRLERLMETIQSEGKE